MEDMPKDAAGDPRDNSIDDYEPTIRMAMPQPEATHTRRIPKPSPPADEAAEEQPFAHSEKSAVGVFFEHLTGFFRHRGGTFEPVTQPEPPTGVSLDLTDAEEFPPLEGNFERQEELGAGGQAKLYRGFDTHLRRRAAVKSLRAEQCQVPELREKFISEAMITAQLDHPAIVPVYSIHRDKDNRLHLAMKLIHGQPLQKYLGDLVRHYDSDGFSASEEQRSLDYRLEVFLSVCDALEYAHNRNIMHCDLKPENIMIGGYHEAYLMDWGLARKIDDPDFDPKTWKAPTVITGTPRFLSPEALNGERCDKRADIYALGLILYEIVTLQYAYPGRDHQETVGRIRRGEMRPVTHRYKYPIPVDLRKIILKASAWDRKNRYKSVEEFSDDLRKFIRGEEVSANPDSFLGKFVRWGYRHRRIMFSVVLVAVTLGAVGVAYSLYAQIKTDRREAALAAQRHKQQLEAETIEKSRSEFRGRRDHEMGQLLSRAIGVSRTFDRQISKLEHDLSAITADALLLLNAEVRAPAGEPLYSRAELSRGKVPPTMVKAPGFGYEIDLNDIVYHVSPGTKPANPEERIRRLAMLRPTFLRAMIESRQDSAVSKQNLAILKQRIINSGSPLIDIYFGFKDGLFVLYPCSKILPEDFDHRQRQWYKERVDGSRAAVGALWGAPYLSVDGDVMLPCSLQMIDAAGNFHGVAAIDVSVLKLVESLRGMGDRGGHLLEKTIVDAEGDVVVDIDEKFIKASSRNDGSVGRKNKRIRYRDIPLFKRIKARRNGVIMRLEKGRHVAYVFSGMYSVEWYYIEKIDLEKFLAERGIQVPDGFSPVE